VLHNEKRFVISGIQMQNGKVSDLILSTIKDTLSTAELMPAEKCALLDTSTVLLGNGAIVDSLGLVTVIVNLEQKLEQAYGISVSLADERAMSHKSSPFRTVSSLTEYVGQLLSETARQ